MKVAVAQIACVLGDVAANLKKIDHFARQAKAAAADVVVFPELADTGYEMSAIKTLAQPWTEAAVPALRELARELPLAIVCGVSERVGTAIYNSQVMVDTDGEIAGSYRKTHLFCAGGVDEKECFTAGDELAAVTYKDFRLGLTICYDLRFPELYRELATEAKTNVFVVSSAWPFPRVEHLRIVAAARAIENQSYLVLANRVGTDGRLTFCGNSSVIDPSGTILAAGSAEREELLIAELTLETVTATRSRMTVFEHRRPEIYGRAATRE